MRSRAQLPAVRLLAFLLVCAVPRAGAQGAPSDSTIRSWLKARVDNGYATGIVVGMRDRGRDRVVSYGGAERSGSALGATSLFEIGSITKVFTNILLADMVLKGEVALDDPVAKYLPSGTTIPSRNGKVITLLDLATASSGLPGMPSNFAPRDIRNPYADYTVQQMYDFLGSHSLRRDPGTLYEYSNLGMGLLGHALALRAGMPYERLITERVLAPLGMRETVVTVPAALAPRFAVPHDGDLEEVLPWDLPTLAGAGALRSTTRDMLRFADAVTHRSRGPLGRAIALSIEPRRPTTIPDMRIALGWHVREKAGTRIVWHNGGTGGFRTFFGFNPTTGAHVMVWSNTSSSVDDLGLHLLDSTVALRPTPPQSDVSVPVETLRSYVGEYPLAPAFVVTVTESGGKLYARATNQPRFRLWAESPTNFYLRAVPAKVRFERDSAGALALVLDQGGRMQRALRKPQGEGAPSVRRINPPTLSKPTGYTHVVEASGGRTLYISGQVALDSTGALVGGGDFRAQAIQALDNLRRALAAGGASFADVVKVTWYVTDASQVGVVREVRGRYFSGDEIPASTFVEVRALARPEWLIEVEAIAVVR